MKYFENYMADAVVRIDDEGNRYVKKEPRFREVLVTDKDSKTAFGGEGYGVFYILEPITKEDYEGFGKTWGWSNDGYKRHYFNRNDE